MIVPTKIDSANHIRDIGTSGDQHRAFVDHGIIDFADFIVVFIAGLDQVTMQLCAKCADSLLIKMSPLLGNRLNSHRFSSRNLGF